MYGWMISIVLSQLSVKIWSKGGWRIPGAESVAAMVVMREGDWMCPSCNNHNYADKINCNRPGGIQKTARVLDLSIAVTGDLCGLCG